LVLGFGDCFARVLVAQWVITGRSHDDEPGTPLKWIVDLDRGDVTADTAVEFCRAAIVYLGCCRVVGLLALLAGHFSASSIPTFQTLPTSHPAKQSVEHALQSAVRISSVGSRMASIAARAMSMDFPPIWPSIALATRSTISLISCLSVRDRSSAIRAISQALQSFAGGWMLLEGQTGPKPVYRFRFPGCESADRSLAVLAPIRQMDL